MNKITAFSSLFVLSSLLVGCGDAPEQSETSQQSSQQTAQTSEATEQPMMQEEDTVQEIPSYIMTAVNSETRTESNKARDMFRRPAETLHFFGIQPNMTVVEIWPGGGWYTEILAPLLQEQGTLYAAHFPAESSSDYFNRSRAEFADRVANEDIFSGVQITEFNVGNDSPVAPVQSADMVLTFRNLHNWYMAAGEEGLQSAFSTFYTALKPGGILGVVDHRLPEDRPDDQMTSTGYIKESVAVAMAEAAGFILVESSDINANPMDTADYPRGVWTLPPTLRLGDENRER